MYVSFQNKTKYLYSCVCNVFQANIVNIYKSTLH